MDAQVGPAQDELREYLFRDRGHGLVVPPAARSTVPATAPQVCARAYDRCVERNRLIAPQLGFGTRTFGQLYNVLGPAQAWLSLHCFS